MQMMDVDLTTLEDAVEIQGVPWRRYNVPHVKTKTKQTHRH